MAPTTPTTPQNPQTPQDPPNWFQTITGQAATSTAQALVVGQQTAANIQQAGTAVEQSAAGIAVIGGVLGGAWAAVKDWVANPLRIVKLALGLSFIGVAVVIAFLPEIGAVIAVASGAPELAPAIRAAGRRPKQTVAQVEQASVQEGFRQVTAGRPQPRQIATPPKRPGAAPFNPPPQPPAGPPAPQSPAGLLGTIPNPFKTNPAAPFPGVFVRPGTPTQPQPIPQLPGATIPSGKFRTDPGTGGGVGVLGAGAQAADAANLPVPANDPLERIIGGRLATPSPRQQRQVRRDIPGIISQWQRIADNPNLSRADREDAQARIDALRAVMLAPTEPPSRPTLPPPVIVPRGNDQSFQAPETLPDWEFFQKVNQARAATNRTPLTYQGFQRQRRLAREDEEEDLRRHQRSQQRRRQARSGMDIIEEVFGPPTTTFPPIDELAAEIAAQQQQALLRAQLEDAQPRTRTQKHKAPQQYVPGGGIPPTPMVAPFSEMPKTTPMIAPEEPDRTNEAFTHQYDLLNEALEHDLQGPSFAERVAEQRHQIGRQEMRDLVTRMTEEQEVQRIADINRRIKRARGELVEIQQREPEQDETTRALNERIAAARAARLAELKRQARLLQREALARRKRQKAPTQPPKRYPKYHD